MGATGIEEEWKASSAEDAYKKAYDLAMCNHGDGPYNGTITTTTGFIDKTDLLNEFLRDSQSQEAGIERWMQEAEDNTSKWGKVWVAKLPEDCGEWRSWVERPPLDCGKGRYILIGVAAE